MADFVIRPLAQGDLARVATLETLCFSAPWSASSLTLLTAPPNGGFVAVSGDEIVGYIGFLGVLDELEITNVATHPNVRRRGVGRALVGKLLELARQNAATRVTLEVRTSNLPAITLYESLGFTPCGIRKNFYSNPREDGVIYEFKF